MKLSSRAGRFKKKLVSEEALAIEAPLIEARMVPLHELHRLQKISDCELTALFIITALSVRYPGSWLGSKRQALKKVHSLPFSMDALPFEPNIKRRLEGLSLGDAFTSFAFKSTPQTVNRAILNWSSGDYPLELMFRIPSSAEVLDQQKHGRRCVTVLTQEAKTSRYILGERDSLSFTMHDLIHADHFYHDNECYEGQLALYGFLHRHQNDFKELLQNPSFQAEFEYLISDMNAYAIHSLKCLKAAITHYGSEDAFIQWVEKFETKRELLALNTVLHDPAQDDPIILKWLAKFQNVPSYTQS